MTALSVTLRFATSRPSRTSASYLTVTLTGDAARRHLDRRRVRGRHRRPS